MKRNRREFLKASTALAAGSLFASGAVPASASQAAQAQANGIPPHRPVSLTGIHAYTDRLSVALGETVHFHVSSTLPYEFSVCRLGQNVDDPAGDEVLQSWKVNDPVAQPIHPGSYLLVEKGLPPDSTLKGLTLECWVRLWYVPGAQALLGQSDHKGACGYALMVNENGSISFYLGDGGAYRPDGKHTSAVNLLTRPIQPKVGNAPVQEAKWHHVVATFDGEVKQLWVDGKAAGRWTSKVAVKPGSAPLRVGALGNGELADYFLDGDLAGVAIYDRALPEAEIRQRFEARAARAPDANGLLAYWAFAEEKGDQVADSSAAKRHARIINHATWMIGGPAFVAAVDRFSSYDPTADPQRGHGLRLASDDLYDCRWKSTHEFRIPEKARQGIYVGRFRVTVENQPRLYHVLFVVKKPAERPKAPVLFLCSTNTWKAYGGTPFAETWPGIAETIGHSYKNSPGNPPNYCFYWRHAGGQGTYQLGLKMPWPVAGPYTFHQTLEWQCSHLCHADRLSLIWLEKEGYAYDVASDLDLHRNPALLDGYKAVFIVGHSEYWSREGMNGVRSYLKKGGGVVCLSGNTMFWRVSFNEDQSIIECRKADAPGSQVNASMRGELWHSHDGKRGGMWRECGLPAWQVLGLEFMSLHGVGVEGVGAFRVTDPDHFLFNKPHALKLKKGDTFGGAPRGIPAVIGHEGDVRVSTLAKFCRKPLPKGATHPEEDPKGIELLAEGVVDWKKVKTGSPYDYFQRAVVAEPERTAADVAGEMIYWEPAEGGRIFFAGSVCAGRGFSNDPKFGLLVKNVLDRLGVAAPKG